MKSLGVKCVLLVLLAASSLRADDQQDYEEETELMPCGETSCHREVEQCTDDLYCECIRYFERYPNDTCNPCPAEGRLCRSCCISDRLTCHNGICQRCMRDENGHCITQDSLFFLTAAQVALATAMVLGVIALSVLLYKTFRTRCRRNSPMLENEARQSVSSRVSLSSIQQRVVRRLRDRPPKYETRHNYEYNQREQPGVERQDSQPADTGQPTRIVGHNDPPPTYEGDVVSLAEFPPPYSPQDDASSEQRIAVINVPPATEPAQPNATEGIANPTFVDDDKPAEKDPDPVGSKPKTESTDITLVSSEEKSVYL